MFGSVAKKNSFGSVANNLFIWFGSQKKYVKRLECKTIEMDAPSKKKELSLYPRTGNFRINNTPAVPFIIDSSAMSIIGKTEVFFGGARLFSVPEMADDRSTSWNATGTIILTLSGTPTVVTLQADASAVLPRWGRIGSGVLSVANAETQIYMTGSGAIINIPARLKSVKQIFCVFSRLSSSTVVHTIPPINSTSFTAAATEFVPINLSGMSGATSTFVKGDGCLNAAGLFCWRNHSLAFNSRRRELWNRERRTS
ncbi:hypothetical protein T492DRAFT_831601 [Pavlovales sp. CCMP2436]|nr:hypothetical protein T492DRAFT_831601 [Pavlovales sp. CCMP2436]